jgi:catechol 2,3-dioxygenase-like lactoylglutathione lyase family enzyme
MPRGGEAAARAFYVTILGLEEVPKPAALEGRGGLWLVGPGVHLHLGVEEPFAPARKAHPALVVDDLRRARAVLSRAGVAIREDDAAMGIDRFYTDDPFGNRLELVAEADRGFTSRSSRGRETID